MCKPPREGQCLVYWEGKGRDESSRWEKSPCDPFSFILPIGVGLQGLWGLPLKKKRRFKLRRRMTCPRSPDMDMSYRLDSKRGAGVFLLRQIFLEACMSAIPFIWQNHFLTKSWNTAPDNYWEGKGEVVYEIWQLFSKDWGSLRKIFPSIIKWHFETIMGTETAALHPS